MTNARFEDLEKRAKKIKLKKYAKFSFLLTVLITLSSYFVVQIMPKYDFTKKPLHVKKITKIQEKKMQQFVPIQKVVKVEKKVESIKEKPTYDTIKLKLNISVPSANKTEVKVTKEKIIVKEEPIKKIKINMQVKEVKKDEALLQRFKVAGDFESANSLANLYFKKKRFERSIYWSKKASKLDAKEASSWLIYAKSKYKLGKKDEAIKSLELYLDYFSSDEIRKLLNAYRRSK